MKILILGGTGEGRALAGALVARGRDVVSSLAGRTQAPVLPEGAVRIGGFGGVAGLVRYLGDTGIDVVIDATHPFAAQMSAHAVAACAETGVRLIRLERAPWAQPEGADWIDVPDMAAAARALPAGARVLLTVGRQEVAAFYGRTDCAFVVRVIDVPAGIPSGWRVIAERGPFALADERALMVREGITHLVSKNAGGRDTVAKILAAAALGVPVVMVARPVVPVAETVARVAEVLGLVDAEG